MESEQTASGGGGRPAVRPAGNRPDVMPWGRYRPFPTIDLPYRRWPGRRLERAPRWCSVDLRDGNQALVSPMGWERKVRLFETLVSLGFREIEIGFPSASRTEYDFVRRLVEEERIPEDVTVQVLTPCREELIERTFAAIEGIPRAIVHLYNSTSELQRRVVFGEDRAGIRDIALRGAAWVRQGAAARPPGSTRFNYTPESFSQTELDFALEVAECVLEALGASAARPCVLNLPATVEAATPNVYADQIEWIDRHLSRREAVVLSVHPHNDRGSAVAAAELALMAGADRVEGTLFGNGERTGNVDLVTLALNLMSQGVDPELDLRDLPALVRRVEHANQLPVPARHPYAGELVYTAFSGSHQDAIRKGLAALRGAADDEPGAGDAGEATGGEPGAGARGAWGRIWEVPYLPIDPADVGRRYEAVIRINSQSGKGGVAWVLESEQGYRLPRRMQIELSACVQQEADARGDEITGAQVAALFEREYLAVEGGPRLVGKRRLSTAPDGRGDRVEGTLVWGGWRRDLVGTGNGPIDAFVSALSQALGSALRIGDYHEHALGAGADAQAVAYVELVLGPDRRLFGAGRAASILEASFAAVLSAVARAAARGWIDVPASDAPGVRARTGAD